MIEWDGQPDIRTIKRRAKTEVQIDEWFDSEDELLMRIPMGYLWFIYIRMNRETVRNIRNHLTRVLGDGGRGS